MTRQHPYLGNYTAYEAGDDPVSSLRGVTTQTYSCLQKWMTFHKNQHILYDEGGAFSPPPPCARSLHPTREPRVPYVGCRRARIWGRPTHAQRAAGGGSHSRTHPAALLERRSVKQLTQEPGREDRLVPLGEDVASGPEGG